MTPEKRFENRVKRYFHSIGIYPAGYPEDKMTVEPIGWYFKVWGGGFQKAGIPDIMMCIGSMFVPIELKSDTGHPTDLQELNIDRIRYVGSNAVILYPSGWDKFKVNLDTFCTGIRSLEQKPVFDRVYK